MREEIQNNPKLFVIVLITAMVFLLVIVFFLLIMIWSPDDDEIDVNIDDVSSLGTYNYVSTSEKTVVEKYAIDILDAFSQKNKEDIYNLVSDDYITYRGFDIDSLYKNLENKGLLGKLLKFEEYQVTSHYEYGKIYELKVGTYDSYIDEKILLIEYSPRNYKISFDSFIGVSDKERKILRDGMELTITNIEEYTSEMTLNLTIKNTSNYDVIINKDSNYENIYLKLSNRQEIRMSSVWLSGVTKTLTPNYTVDLDVKFNSDYLFSGIADSIIIKDVYNTMTKDTKDIEFPF